MFIIAHRGLWKHPAERNTLTAFENAFKTGFGIETDIRDCLGKIVISHGLSEGNEVPLEVVLEKQHPIYR